ncbi:hypothetical protein D3C80_2067450 [compost metagenome]
MLSASEGYAVGLLVYLCFGARDAANHRLVVRRAHTMLGAQAIAGESHGNSGREDRRRRAADATGDGSYAPLPRSSGFP